MANSVFISTIQANSGKSLISLGVMDFLLRKTNNVGYFRPVISSENEQLDYHTDLILSHFQLNQKYHDTFVFTIQQMKELISEGKSQEVIEVIVERYNDLVNKYDIILIEGTDFLDASHVQEFDLNAEIARNIGAPVVLVTSGRGIAIEEIAQETLTAFEAFRAFKCEVVGVVINRWDIDENNDYLRKLKRQIGAEIPVSIVPENTVLASPTIAEVVTQLNAEVLYGAKEAMDQLAFRFSVAGMRMDNYLDTLTENCAVICSADRSEIILAVLQAHQSSNYPHISCIILSGSFEMEPSITRLLNGLTYFPPIIRVRDNTYNTAIKLSGLKSNLTNASSKKILQALNYFHYHVDAVSLFDRMISFQPKGMPPKMFKYQVLERARSTKKRIVFPEGNDERIITAVDYLVKNQIIDAVLLGDETQIKQKSSALGLGDLDKITVIQPRDNPNFNHYVDRFCELRKHKHITKQMATDLMNDVSYFGTMMVLEGEADGMVSGAVHTTQHTIRPALQLIKTKPGIKTVSSAFFMCLEERVLVYADCAVNPTPNADQLSEIAISAAETANRFGIEPRVALLSYSSGSSGKGEQVDKIKNAAALLKARSPLLISEGPIQYDAAVDPVIARNKMPDSILKGKASVLVFPDLNTGNNTYKAVQRETGAVAIGPILQGLNKPVNDLSRGCTVEDIINTAIITAIQAQ